MRFLITYWTFRNANPEASSHPLSGCHLLGPGCRDWMPPPSIPYRMLPTGMTNADGASHPDQELGKQPRAHRLDREPMR